MSLRKRKILPSNSPGKSKYLLSEREQQMHESLPDATRHIGNSNNQILFNNLQKQELLINGQPENTNKNHIPVAYIEVKRLGYSFLVTELYESNADLAFGLCDFNSNIKFSTFSLKKLKQDLEGENYALATHSDFLTNFPIGIYAKVADTVGTIVTDHKDRMLKPVFEKFFDSEWSDKSQNLADLKI